MLVSPRTRRSESLLHKIARRRVLASMIAAWAAAAFAPAAEAQQLAEQFNITPSYVMGLTAPTDIAFTPDGRAIITLKGGQIRIRQTNGTLTTLSGLFPGISTTSEQGLLSVVVDPDFATNQRLYFYVSDGPDNTDRHRVRRATLSATNMITVETTPLVSGGLRSSNGNGFGNHNGGGMVIHNGHLYIGVGDTGFNASPPNNKYSSCLNVANGKILRVQLSDGQAVADNPLSNLTAVTGCSDVANPRGGMFVDTSAPDKRIFAWGLRNPWRLWVDPMTGLVWIGDVGEQEREEISVGPAGSHFGYPFREGSRDWRAQQTYNRDCMDMTPAKACVAPAVDYPHAGDDENSVTGGLIPSGCGWSEATGGKAMYFFGDHGAAGRIWNVEVNAARTGVVGQRQLFAEVNGGGPASFRQGSDAALYVVLEARGAVMRIAPKACTNPGGAGGAGGGGGGMSGGSGGRGAGGAAGGASGMGGVQGGSGGRGGAPAGSGGVTGSGGASASTGGVTGSGSGGQTSGGSTGGSSGSGGSAGPAGSGGRTTTGGSNGDGGGCGCSTAGVGPLSSLSGVMLLLGLAAARRRRSRR